MSRIPGREVRVDTVTDLGVIGNGDLEQAVCGQRRIRTVRGGGLCGDGGQGPRDGAPVPEAHAVREPAPADDGKARHRHIGGMVRPRGIVHTGTDRGRNVLDVKQDAGHGALEPDCTTESRAGAVHADGVGGAAAEELGRCKRRDPGTGQGRILEAGGSGRPSRPLPVGDSDIGIGQRAGSRHMPVIAGDGQEAVLPGIEADPPDPCMRLVGVLFAAPPDHIGTDPELEGELLGRKAVERPSLRVEGFDVDVVARGVAAEKVYPHVVHLLPVVAAQHRPGRFAPRKQRAVGNERPCGGIAPHRSGKLGIGPQQELHLDGRHAVRSGFGAIGDAGRAAAQHQGKENRYGNETFHLIGG